MSMSSISKLNRGREIDAKTAILTGEGAHKKVTDLATSHPVAVWGEVPSARPEGAKDYYRLQLVKEQPWTWAVPLYFYTGGVAGGAGVLGAVLQATGYRDRLTRWCRWLTFGSISVSALLLTWDLGKPQRFLYMLRVFRPTSPMSWGSWALAESGVISGAAAVLSELNGPAGTAGRAATISMGIHGAFLAGYTGVLLSNSATPIWKHSRYTLPLLFTASGMAATAALLEFMPLQKDEERVVRRFGRLGKMAEAAAIMGLEAETAGTPGVSSPLRQGTSGVLWSSAKICLAAGIILNLIPGKHPAKRRIGAFFTTVGSIFLRYALMEAGRASALDPQATIHPQRISATWLSILQQEAR